MGIYNTYDGVQIKIGKDLGKTFEIGDEVPLADGVYVGREGFIVISFGILIAKHKKMKDKWGNTIVPKGLLREVGP